MKKRASRFNLEAGDEIIPAGIETPSSAAHRERGSAHREGPGEKAKSQKQDPANGSASRHNPAGSQDR